MHNFMPLINDMYFISTCRLEKKLDSIYADVLSQKYTKKIWVFYSAI